MKKIYTFLLFLIVSQIFISCNSYVNLDFTDRKLIKKLPDEKYLQANKPEEKKLKISEELENSVPQENKFVNDFYANENEYENNSCEKVNLVASVKSEIIYQKPTF